MWYIPTKVWGRVDADIGASSDVGVKDLGVDGRSSVATMTLAGNFLMSFPATELLPSPKPSNLLCQQYKELNTNSLLEKSGLIENGLS